MPVNSGTANEKVIDRVQSFDPNRKSPWLMLGGNRIQTAWSVDRFFADFLLLNVSCARNATPI
jgi:hypothetical protein